ncbi:MAG: MFS transporter, partial [Nitriliruptoraceae bacterium]
MAIQGWVVRTLGVHLLIIIAMASTRPMVSYRALELGATNAQLGMIAGSYALLSLFLAIPTGRWVDRWGEPRFLTLGALLVMASGAWLTQISSLALLAAATATLGFGHLTMMVGMQTIMSNGGDPAHRDARIGAMTVVAAVAFVVGPGLAGFVAEAPWGGLITIFAATGVLGAVGAALALSVWIRPPASHEVRSAPQEAREPALRAIGSTLRVPGVLQAMIASMAALASADIVIAFLPAYGEANGIAVSTVGLLLSVFSAAAMASRATVVHLLRWFGHRLLLTLCVALFGVTLALVATTTVPLAIGILLFIGGFANGLAQPLTLSWIAGRIPPRNRGIAIGIRLSGNRAAQFVIPIGVGALAGLMGLGLIFVTLAAMLLGSGVLVA